VQEGAHLRTQALGVRRHVARLQLAQQIGQASSLANMQPAGLKAQATRHVGTIVVGPCKACHAEHWAIVKIIRKTT
jgi:hypothetical protein